MVGADVELSTLYRLSEMFYSQVHCEKLSVKGAVAGL